MFNVHVIYLIIYNGIVTCVRIICTKFIDGSSKAKQGLSEKCLLACTCAASQLELVSQQICVGDVTLSNIEKIIARLEQIKRLSDAAKKADNSKEHPDLYQTVLRRQQEFQVYQDQKIYLENVCQKLDHTIEGQITNIFIHIARI